MLRNVNLELLLCSEVCQFEREFTAFDAAWYTLEEGGTSPKP
jgi:hypothetical protein